MAVAVQDIVHAFLQTYYQRMRKDPSKVSCLYSATAELTHINYQVDFDCNADSLSTIKLTGKENISRFFTRNNKKVSDLKTKIDTCDFQTSGVSQSSILILTTGEMYWSGTPAYRFCQSIVLQPNADNKNAFDVTNDVIRFIRDDLKPYSTKTSQDLKEDGNKAAQPVINGGPKPQDLPTKVETTEPEIKSVESAELDSKKECETRQLSPENGSEASESEKADTNNKINQTMKSKEVKTASTGEETVKNEIEKPAKSETEVSPTADKVKISSAVPETDDKPTAPPVRMSWASKLAASGDSFKASAPTASHEPTKTEAPQPPNNRKAVETKSEFQPVQKENINNKTAKKKPQFSTVNKDGFYPIYIKGTAGIKEEKLKSALEDEFGTIMKMTTADSFAVVDFQTQKSQMDALERKQLTVGDTEVYLSRKTVKKSSSTPPVGSSGSIRSHKKHSNKKRD